MFTSFKPGRIVFARSFLARTAGMLAILIAGLSCAVALGGGEQAPVSGLQQVSAHPKGRLGVYDSRCVAVAFGRSPAFINALRDLHRQHAAALEAGDEQKATQLVHQGELAQLRMHLQVFSNAPVDDIIGSVQGELQLVAEQHSLIAIAPDVSYHDPSFEIVDITDDVVALFNPDNQTLRVVSQVRTQKPQAIEEVARMPIVK